METFRNYVQNHETQTPQSVQEVETEISNWNQDVVQASVNVSWEVIPTTPKWSSAWHPEIVRPTSNIDNFEFEINKKEEIDATLATEIVQKEKEAWRTSILLEKLKRMTPEVATILAGFEWELRFPALEELNSETLKAFMSENSKCTLVKFPWGYIEKKDDKFSISITDGETLTDITDKDITEDICWLLVKKAQSTVQQPISSSTTPTSSTQTTWNWNNQTQAVITWWDTQQQSWNQQWWDNSRISDIQQQYEWVWYNIDNPETTKQATTDEEAIQFLTKWSWMWVFFIARLFGKKKHSEELSIVDANYEPTWQEKTDLNNLNKYL